jgi:hypothetical protein
MSNIQIEIKINNTLSNTEGDPIVLEGAIVENMLLNPFYATEKDVLNNIIEDPSNKQIIQVKEIIFNNSILADEQISSGMLKPLGLTDQEIFMLKRRFVICSSTWEFVKSVYSTYLSSIKKSKSLADMQVSLDIQNDPSIIKSIIEDAKKCKNDILSMINTSSGTGFQSFVKGSKNPCNKRYGRGWLPSSLDKGHYAAYKTYLKGCSNTFKTGL